MNQSQLTHEVAQKLEQKKQSEFWPEFISAKDLLALPPDPTRWIWDLTLPVSGCSVLVAKPKVGKTTLAVNLSIAVARGLPFLGRDTQKSPVAYLSLDASLPEIMDTYRPFNLRDDDPIFIHAGTAPAKVFTWLMQRVKEHGVRLVIIDTLQKFFKFEKINNYDEVINISGPLLDEARNQNVHLLFTHHAKKESGDDLDSAIGSTGIRAMAYTYLHLKRLPESERRILRSDQRNGKNFPELALRFDRNGWLEVLGTRDEAEVEEVKPKILELLESEGCEIGEKEIRQQIPARGWIVGQALRQALKANEIDRTVKGRRGDPFRYSITSLLALSSPITSSRGENRGNNTGLESKTEQKSLETQGEILVPENPDENGTRKDEKRDPGLVGLESKSGKWTQKI